MKTKIEKKNDVVFIEDLYKSSIDLSQVAGINQQDGGVEVFLKGGQRMWVQCDENASNTLYWLLEQYHKVKEIMG